MKTTKDIIYLSIYCIALIIITFLVYAMMIEVINQKMSYKPDLKVEYWANYKSVTCEANALNKPRQDFYDICPYIIHRLNVQLNLTN